MATLHVRNVPDDLYDRIRVTAESDRRSLSSEVIELLERGLADRGRYSTMDEWLDEARRIADGIGPMPSGIDSAALVRRDREEQ
jgi:plasmid stability protein